MGWAGGGAAATYLYLKRKKKGEKLKWECVEVNHHKNVGGTIEEWEKNGWSLYSYNTAGYGTAINHYLLFSRSE
jgi:hypothetical protein